MPRASARTTTCSRSARGWGGFALHLARERGCRVTTATISREQHALATQRVRGGRPGRSHRGRLQRLPAARGLLQPHRLDRDDRGDRPPPARHVLRHDRPAARARTGSPASRRSSSPTSATSLPPPARLDPQAHLPGRDAAVARGHHDAARRSSDLMVHDVREIGPHYARTLREWRERFLLRRARGRGARSRPALPAHLGVLPGVLRGGLRDACAARRAARAHAAAQPHPAGLASSDPSRGARRRAGRPAAAPRARAARAGGRRQHGEAGDLGQPQRERPVVLEPEDRRELGLVAELAEHARDLVERAGLDGRRRSPRRARARRPCARPRRGSRARCRRDPSGRARCPCRSRAAARGSRSPVTTTTCTDGWISDGSAWQAARGALPISRPSASSTGNSSLRVVSERRCSSGCSRR